MARIPVVGADVAAPRRVGIVGTGPIARSFARLVETGFRDLVVGRILTRRRIDSLAGFPAADRLTDSLDELVASSDVVLEASGDVLHATRVTARSFEAGLPVVTVNTEFHLTTSSHFVGRGLLTEAEGAQPGCTAALREEALQMGFRPLVFGNVKGFLKHDPTPEDMAYWAKRQGISVPNTTGATDGTKVQMEQAFIANGLGGTVSRRGLEGPVTDDLAEVAARLGPIADRLGEPIADYVLSSRIAPGVFLVCRHDPEQAGLLRYYKLGDGPYYTLVKPYHLVSLEIAKTVRRVLSGGGVLLDNGARPRVSVAAIAKRSLDPGTRIAHGNGSFEVRGEAIVIADDPAHVPIGLLRDAVLRRRVESGQLLRIDDVDLPDDEVTRIGLAIHRRAAGEPASAPASRLKAAAI